MELRPLQSPGHPGAWPPASGLWFVARANAHSTPDAHTRWPDVLSTRFAAQPGVLNPGVLIGPERT